jgi:cytochrome c peroxidase
MRMMGMTLMVLTVLMAGSATSAMQHEATREKGKALFSDPKLGSTGKTCNDCHKDGTGLERSGEQKDLEKTVNKCITTALKGKKLKPKSAEMQSLLLYLRGLGGEQKPAAKKAPVGC